MKAELKQKWVNALRSGKYKQGKGCLRDINDNFCCLGVYCDLRQPDNWVRCDDLKKYKFDKYYFSSPYRELGKEIGSDYLLKNLIDMNDGGMSSRKQKNFSQIADYIEQNIPGE